ncbi:25S rRNA (uracil2634-N3)-methyltransferase, partial [Aspergillus candidus]
DFSFARALVTQHRCKNVLATCYDDKETLYSKYPQAEQNINDTLTAFAKTNDSSGDTAEENDDQPEKQKQQTQRRHGPDVLFSVDARKLGASAGGGKDVRGGYHRKEPRLPAWVEAKRGAPSNGGGGGGGPWDLICFNFPHVGGISTDVNRQVRANQELLVGFFKACVPLLSLPPRVHSEGVDDDEWEMSESESDLEESDEDDGQSQSGAKDITARTESKLRTDPGQILVTMFEREPYTLWNVKDLARHAGLRVVTSFKFPWASYKEYAHARTVGEIEGKNGGRGGWRGEDREARMYVFEVKQDEKALKRSRSAIAKQNMASKNKRSRHESDSEGDD